MLKKYAFIICSFFFYSNLFGQNAIITYKSDLSKAYKFNDLPLYKKCSDSLIKIYINHNQNLLQLYETREAEFLSKFDPQKAYLKINEIIHDNNIFLKDSLSIYDTNTIKAYIKIAKITNNTKELVENLLSLNQRIENLKFIYNKNSFVHLIFHNLSILFLNTKDYSKYIYCQTRSLLFTDDKVEKINVLINISKVLFNIYGYNEAKIFLFKALTLIPTKNDKILYYDIYKRLGNCYLKTNQLSLAKKYYDLSFKNIINNNTNKGYLCDLFEDIGNYYNKLKMMDSSMYYYKKSIPQAVSTNNNTLNKISSSLNNLGNLEFNFGNYKSALLYYTHSLIVKRTVKPNLNANLAQSYNNIAIALSKFNRYSESFIYFSESISYLSNRYFLKVKDTHLTSTLFDLMFTYFKFGELLIEYNNIAHDDISKYYARICFSQSKKLLTRIITFNNDEQNIIELENIYRKINEYQIYLMLLEPKRNHIVSDTLFNLIDQCHNNLLFNKLISKNKTSLNKLDFNLLHDCDNESFYSKIFKIENDENSNLEELKTAYSNLFNSIATIYSNMKISLFNETSSNTFKTVPLKDLQNKLSSKTIVLEYLTLKEKLYCFILTKTHSEFLLLGNYSKIANLISNFEKNVNKANINYQQIDSLSSYLITPISSYLLRTNKIVIIPDKKLWSLPFDLLKTPGYKSGKKFLFLSHSIVYSFSSRLLSLDRNCYHNNNYSVDFLGIAPFSYPSTIKTYKQYFLKNSQSEILSIDSIFKVKNYHTISLLGVNANYNKFGVLFPKSRICHISTHTFFHNNYGGILMHSRNNPGVKVFDYYDVLNSKGSPELVILATCNGDYGKNMLGEGPINLVRAFSLNNSSSIIYSTTKLDDLIGKFFLQNFHKRFLNGESKAEALYNVKRDFYYNYKKYHISQWIGMRILCNTL